MAGSKYRNKRCVIDGHNFDSHREGKRYTELKLLERIGEIKELELQPEFTFMLPNGKLLRSGAAGRPRKYVADFRYKEKRKSRGQPTWHVVVEDVKGAKTEIYKIKRDLMRDLNGILIKET